MAINIPIVQQTTTQVRSSKQRVLTNKSVKLTPKFAKDELDFKELFKTSWLGIQAASSHKKARPDERRADGGDHKKSLFFAKNKKW